MKIYPAGTDLVLGTILFLYFSVVMQRCDFHTIQAIQEEPILARPLGVQFQQAGSQVQRINLSDKGGKE